MIVPELKRVKTFLGFLSMMVAWSLMNIFYMLFEVLKNGKTSDPSVLFFWSFIYIVFAWLIFLLIPLKKLDPNGKLFSPLVFIFISTLYGTLVSVLLNLLLFQSTETISFLLPLGSLTGFFFGLTYSLLIRSNKLIYLLDRKPGLKIIAFLYPIMISLLIFYLFPKYAPQTAFRFMPSEIRESIVAETIPKFNVGDSLERLKAQLPGYFEGFDDGNGALSFNSHHFSFVIQVHCNKIVRLEYIHGSRSFDASIHSDLRP